MPRMIQIRNVPDELHRELKARAAMAGLSLSGYLLAEIRTIAGRPSLDPSRLASRSPVRPSVSPADAVRDERDGR